MQGVLARVYWVYKSVQGIQKHALPILGQYMQAYMIYRPSGGSSLDTSN